MSKENIKDKSISKNGVSIAHVKISRQNGKMIMFLKLGKEIENIFKSDEIATSNAYRSNGDNLKYYKIRNCDDANMNNFEISHNCIIRNYGSGLYAGGVPNFSIIRSVGTSKNSGVKIVLDGIISSDAIQKYVSEFKDFLRDFYKQFVSDVIVQTELRIQEI